jgi:peptidoglycan/xylan/chitin deacetylase (PgdA/CDA1 family)
VKPFTDAVKGCLGVIALAPALNVRTQKAHAASVNVVYAHHIGTQAPSYVAPDGSQRLERLDATLRVLGRRFRYVSLARLLADEAPDPREQPSLAVTFDDGFDLLSNGVAEVLTRHRIRATTFVITETIGNRDLMWRNKLNAIRTTRHESVYVTRFNELAAKTGLALIGTGRGLMAATAAWPMERKEEFVDELWVTCRMPRLSEFLDEHRPYFTWAGLEAWLAQGHAVGLHTATHPFCSRLGPGGVEVALVEAAAMLRERLGVPFLPLSYPFGDRVEAGLEKDLVRRGVIDAAFGIRGFSPRGTPRHALERACIDGHVRFEVFGRTLLGPPV